MNNAIGSLFYAVLTSSLSASRLSVRLGGFLLFALFTIPIAAAKYNPQNEAKPSDLTKMSLEELMNIEVTTVSKSEKKLSDTAAAVFVITAEDIRRSGVTNIPDALRMAPGLQVARIDSNKWAVSSRGFNDFNVSKFLVLIDGRSAFLPTFSGVFWDVQDFVIEDVERIEVIRGPGTAYWDAYAVNGVINIITKHAKETRGGLISAGIGTEERGFGTFRYGGVWGENIFYRLFTQYVQRDGFVDENGIARNDDWDLLKEGFRVDWEPSGEDWFTFVGGLYSGETGSRNRFTLSEEPYFLEIDHENEILGGHLLGRWEHTFSDSSDVALQMYYDRAERDFPFLKGKRDIFDIDFRHHLNLDGRQDLVWGLSYRFSSDDLDGDSFISFDPAGREDHFYSFFAHDEITLIADRLRLILGSNFSQNDYMGFEVQPNARLLWTPHERQIFWTSISRTARTPTRANHDISNILYAPPSSPSNPFDLPITVHVIGNRDITAEELIASEVGYRVLISDQLSLDIASFFNLYDHLITGEPDLLFSPSPGQLQMSMTGDNKGYGETYGVELSADYTPFDWWRMQAAYTFLQMQLHIGKDSGDVFFENTEGESPHHQFSLRSSFDPANNVELDAWIRYVDELPHPKIPAYLALDIRLGWKPRNNLEFSIGAQNLLDRHHAEFGNPDLFPALSAEIERSVYAKVIWQF
ncbi:MAG: TonB-dependent receptor [Candidatus Omnitrophota bacterium]|jgi:iron complex outermembrane receptor protein|nr:MAG: TonB-dependent receptor [Candidatus Omnitrophota bacterium]